MCAVGGGLITVIHFVLENGILSQPASFSKICLENGPIFRCAANAAQQKTVHFPTPAFFLGLAPALIFQRLVSKTTSKMCARSRARSISLHPSYSRRSVVGHTDPVPRLKTEPPLREHTRSAPCRGGGGDPGAQTGMLNGVPSLNSAPHTE